VIEKRVNAAGSVDAGLVRHGGSELNSLIDDFL
jgi:hypothetical protein